MILLPPRKWRFWDYLQEPNNPQTNVIERWYRDVLSEDEGQFQFNSTLKVCRKTEDHTKWIGFKFMQGKLKAERVWELKFKADKRQYRVLGIFGQKQREAILLIGCYHKQGIYTPPNALETASKRAKAFHEGKAGIYERIIEPSF